MATDTTVQTFFSFFLSFYDITHVQHLLSDELNPSPPFPPLLPLELACIGRTIKCKVRMTSGGSGPRELATPVEIKYF